MRASIIARIGHGMTVAEICADLGLSYIVVAPVYREVMKGGWDRVRRPHEMLKKRRAA